MGSACVFILLRPLHRDLRLVDLFPSTGVLLVVVSLGAAQPVRAPRAHYPDLLHACVEFDLK
jgi:hypothetical protein